MNLANTPYAAENSVSMPSVPVVFVVDDDVSVRESLELLIRQAGWEAFTFVSARDFRDHKRVFTPSCLILDVSLPGLDGLELQNLIAGDQHHMPIIFITGHGDIPTSVRAMKAGAVEFLTKPFDDDVLLDAIGQAIEQSRRAIEFEAAIQALRHNYSLLTPRERQVMGMIVKGMLNKQVGADLSLSEITVKAHRGQVMRKMKARSFADLVNMAGRLGLAKT